MYPEPCLQRGVEMGRVGGLTYTCQPKKKIGHGISDLRMISSGKTIESNKKYVVGGWGSVNPNVKGPAIYNLLENYISEKKIIKKSNLEAVKIVGM